MATLDGLSSQQNTMLQEIVRLNNVIEQMGVEITQIKLGLGDTVTKQNTHLKDFEDNVSKIVVNQKLGLEVTVNEAKFTFGKHRENIVKIVILDM